MQAKITFPAFKDCHIAFKDIDERRLEYIERAVKKGATAVGGNLTLS
jgi:alpha-galactosidase/6-phospho-beta-glucosidase family protein